MAGTGGGGVALSLEVLCVLVATKLGCINKARWGSKDSGALATALRTFLSACSTSKSTLAFVKDSIFLFMLRKIVA